MGGDVTDAVEKQCPFFYMIDPIMHDHASIKSPPLSDDFDWENLGIKDEFMDNSEDSTYADTNEKKMTHLYLHVLLVEMIYMRSPSLNKTQQLHQQKHPSQPNQVYNLQNIQK